TCRRSSRRARSGAATRRRSVSVWPPAAAPVETAEEGADGPAAMPAAAPAAPGGGRAARIDAGLRPAPPRARAAPRGGARRAVERPALRPGPGLRLPPRARALPVELRDRPCRPAGPSAVLLCL